MDLVVGATGAVGTETCHRLAAEGRPVRALVRPTSAEEKVQALRNLGAEIAVGDLKDPGSISAACRGATAVLSTASATISRESGDTITTVDLEGQLALVAAADDAGAERFVYVSFPEIDGEFPLQTAKRRVEEALGASGMSPTVLRPALFMEVWLSPHAGFDHAAGRVTIPGEGRNPISWISFRDVAAFAAASLSNPAARGATIELGGPEALAPLEVVRIFEEESGRELAVEHIPVEALRAKKAAATDPLEQTMAGLMLGYTEGLAIDMQGVLEDFAIELTPVRDYVRRVLGR